MIAQSTVSGSINYNLAITDTNWHLVSSPVAGEQYDDTWINDNSIASGTGNNRGISTYDNTTPHATTMHWRYFQAGDAATTFAPAIGYSTLRTAAGDYSFTGTFPDADVSPAISNNDKDDNLLGNPYPSYLDVAAFISANTSNLTATHQAVYVWDGAAYTNLTTGYIHPGQAFFVSSNVASGTATITEAMQSHQTGVTFYRSTSPEINLTLTDGTSSKVTQINYLDGKTKGLNPGFDIGMFVGVSSDLNIFTHLIEDNDGIAFETQALPNADLESMIIPVGVKANAGKEITFTAEAMNLPTDHKVFLEDRQNNTFTRLDEANANYKVTLANSLNGIGRFYLYTTQSALSVSDNTLLTSTSIYKLNNATLRIAGVSQGKASVKLFNILGEQIMNVSFEANGVKDISLPKLATGIYVVQLQTEKGQLNKKIVLE